MQGGDRLSFVADRIAGLLTKTVPRQIFTITVATSSVLVAVVVFIFLHQQYADLLSQQKTHAAALAEIVAGQAEVDPTGQTLALTAFRTFPGLQYALFADLEGRVLAHTDDGRISTVAAALLPLPKSQQGHNPQYLQHTEELIEIAVPIQGAVGQVGWAVVALAPSALEGAIDASARSSATILAVAGTIAGLIILFLALRIPHHRVAEEFLGGATADGKSAFRPLEQNEQWIRQILDSAPSGISVIRVATGERVYVNNQFLEMFGAESLEQLKSFGMLNTYTNDEDYRKAFAFIAQGTGFERFVMQRKKVRGDLWWAMVDAVPVTFMGEPSIISWHHDITDQKNADAELSNLLETSPIGVSIIGRTIGERAYTNRQYFQLFGADSLDQLEEFGYEKSFVSKSDLELVQRHFATGIGPDSVIMQRRKITGEEWWAKIYPVPIRFRGRDTFVVWCTDITDQKKADAELGMLLETSPVGVSIVGKEIDHRDYTNKQYLKLFGAENVQQIKDFGFEQSFVSKSDFELVRRRFETGIGPDSGIMQRRKINGEPWWSKIYAVPIEFRGRNTIVVWIADITDQKKAEANLVQSEKLASLGGLVAGVAHEVNTPIGISVTAASYLQERSADLNKLFEQGEMKKSDLAAFLESTDEACGIISTNLKRAADLVRSFKQVAVDQSTDGIRAFNLFEYIQEVMSSLQPQLKTNGGVKVSVNGDEQLQMLSYPGPFAQILTNLVMNSIIHAFPNGEGAEITVDISADDRKARIVYRDNGKGIEAENLNRVFDPFFTTNRGAGGTGLGLNIVYNLVTQKLAGTIICVSKPGEGVTFDISIPIRTGEEA